MTPFTETLRHLARLPRVRLAMSVGAADGLIIEAAGIPEAEREQGAARHTAALAAYLYAKAGRASSAAGLGGPTFMRLEADRGQLCVVGCGEAVLVTMLERDANLGRIRLDMLMAARSLQ